MRNDLILNIQRASYKYYTGTQALKNVNIEVERGIIYGLLGSNGCGKSTLMNSLSGFLKPQQGKAIMYDGRNSIDLFSISQTSKYFSVVPQHDLYWGNLTVYDHLKYMAMINKLDEEVDIEVILQSLSLKEYAGQRLSKLSEGLKRRVSIAMTLTLQSLIIAFDEPSCGLGVTTKKELHYSILNILKKNSTIIIITHDMEEVE